jgi:hypothetical protein
LDSIKVKFAKLGAGYSLSISAAAEAIKRKDYIHEVLGAATENTGYSKMDFIKSHFFPYYDPSKSLPIASGPHGLISIVDSNLYPVKADEL